MPFYINIPPPYPENAFTPQAVTTTIPFSSLKPSRASQLPLKPERRRRPARQHRRNERPFLGSQIFFLKFFPGKACRTVPPVGVSERRGVRSGEIRREGDGGRGGCTPPRVTLPSDYLISAVTKSTIAPYCRWS